MREYRPENPGNQGGRGWKKRLRVDMQAGTVRLEESRAINGVQHPLHRQSLRSLPAHPRVRSSWAHSSPGGLGCADTPLAALLSEGCVGTLLSLLCFRRGVWGHSSRCFAFGGVSPLLSSGSTVQSASTPHAIVFSEAGKTILDPCKRIVHSPPELNQWCQFRHAINGARVAPCTGISLRSLPFIKRKIRKRPDA